MTHMDAATLAHACLDALEQQDAAAVEALFHADGRWELTYAMRGQDDAERTIAGGRRIARFHANMFSIIERSRFVDVAIEAVSDCVAFVRCRSEARLVTGDEYGNNYLVRVETRDDVIVHWLEYYDPRPAERVRAVLTDALADGPGA